jgi:hypothetical protein
VFGLVVLRGAVVAVAGVIVVADLGGGLDGRELARAVDDRGRGAATRRRSYGSTTQLIQLAKHNGAIASGHLAVAHDLDLVRLELFEQGQDLGHPELVVVGDGELQLVVVGDVPSTLAAVVLEALVVEAIVIDTVLMDRVIDRVVIDGLLVEAFVVEPVVVEPVVLEAADRGSRRRRLLFDLGDRGALVG